MTLEQAKLLVVSIRERIAGQVTPELLVALFSRQIPGADTRPTLRLDACLASLTGECHVAVTIAIAPTEHKAPSPPRDRGAPS